MFSELTANFKCPLSTKPGNRQKVKLAAESRGYCPPAGLPKPMTTHYGLRSVTKGSGTVAEGRALGKSEKSAGESLRRDRFPDQSQIMRPIC